MRVLLDTSFAARGPSGTGVYIEQLATALRARGNVELIAPPGRRRLRPGGAGARRNPLRSAANAVLDALWVQIVLPRAARNSGADVIHHPLPALARRAPCPQVITVHDVAFETRPEDFDPAWRMHARRLHRRAAAGAAAVVCVSEASAADAVGLLGARRDRVVVAPHGPGQALPPLPRDPSERFVLYVGDAEPRKGVDALLDSYAGYRSSSSDPLELVLAGSAAARAGAPGVRGVPAPAPEALADLLARATALVHPSRHEGFGLTLLEAMSAGAPVVAVRNAGTAEVCGEAALLVEPDGLTAALGRVESEPELLRRLAAAGTGRVRGFSWDACAARHEQAYTLAGE